MREIIVPEKYRLKILKILMESSSGKSKIKMSGATTIYTVTDDQLTHIHNTRIPWYPYIR